VKSPDRDQQDAAAGELRERAVENIANRIKAGQSRIGIRDLLDCEMNTRPEFLLTELEQVLLAEHGEHGALADKLVEGLIQRYVETNSDVVEEEAAEIEAHESEEAA
jgi:hypothetical protein